MRAYALDYAEAGYEVFPLRGKVPLIAGGNGVLDATTSIVQVHEWWTRWPTANIAVRVPINMFVLDIDPRNGGEHTLLDLVRQHGPLTPTRTSYSGRGDGGRHYWHLHPGGKLSSKRLGVGLDIKDHRGYVVVPPSVHPDGGKPYWWATPAVEPVLPPAWLTRMVQEPPELPAATRPSHGLSGPTLADSLPWADILEPHGWRRTGGDGEDDGSKWRHPSASAAWSATIRHGCLFVYSSNTPFEQTHPGDPRGYTKLRAYAVLNARGDCKAAHELLRGSV